MPNLLYTHQSHLFFPLHPPISTVRSKTQTFHFPQSIKRMANPRRVKMVAKQIMRELSNMLLTDTVLQHAVLLKLHLEPTVTSFPLPSACRGLHDLQVIAILDKIKAEKGSEEGLEISESPEGDQDWGEEDPDEDIIYVN